MSDAGGNASAQDADISLAPVADEDPRIVLGQTVERLTRKVEKARAALAATEQALADAEAAYASAEG